MSYANFYCSKKHQQEAVMNVCREIMQPHTGERIKQCFEKILNDCKLDEKKTHMAHQASKDLPRTSNFSPQSSYDIPNICLGPSFWSSGSCLVVSSVPPTWPSGVPQYLPRWHLTSHCKKKKTFSWTRLPNLELITLKTEHSFYSSMLPYNI